MIRPILALTVVLVALWTIGCLLWIALSAKARKNYMDTIAAIRWWMVPGGVANLAAVVIIFSALSSWFPPLRIGWWRLLGGTGNVVIGQTGSHGGWLRVAAFCIPGLLLLAVPALAHGEEVGFREGNETRSRRSRVTRLVTFGLMHCVGAGVPLAAGMALITSGAYFERVYLRAVRPLIGEIEAAGRIAEFERGPLPAPPSGPYNAADWARHHEEWDAAWREIDRRLDEWRTALPQQAVDAIEREQEARRPAVAAAAAAHTVSNWIAVTAVFALLVLGYL